MMTHQEQMLHTAHHHKSFRVFMVKAYEIIRDWIWHNQFEMVPVTIDVFRAEHPHVYSSVEKICLSLVIDHLHSTVSEDLLTKLEPVMENKIEQLLSSKYDSQPLPF